MDHGVLPSRTVEKHEDHQAMIFPPGHLAAPHSTPFLPSKPVENSMSTFESPAVYRRLLLSAYIYDYLQRETHTSPAVVLQCEQWMNARSRSVEASIDVVGLLQLDSVKHDERLVLAARKRHAEATQFLHMELSDRQASTEAILGAMKTSLISEVSLLAVQIVAQALLASSEAEALQIYTAVSSGPQSWSLYVSEIVRIADIRGPKLLYTDFGKYLYLMARLCGVSIHESLLLLGQARLTSNSLSMP